jgi:hypothetical protein
MEARSRDAALECRLMLMSRSLAWYRVPGAPPIRVGIARVADRLSVAC